MVTFASPSLEESLAGLQGGGGGGGEGGGGNAANTDTDILAQGKFVSVFVVFTIAWYLLPLDILRTQCLAVCVCVIFTI